MEATGRRRKAVVKYWNTFVSPVSGHQVLVVGFQLRTREMVFQYFAAQYSPTFVTLARATKVRVMQKTGSFDAEKTLGKEVNIIVRRRETAQGYKFFAEVVHP